MGTFLVVSILSILAIAVGALLLLVFQEDSGRHARPTPARQRVFVSSGVMYLGDEPDRDALDWDEIEAANERIDDEWADVMAAHRAWMRDSAHQRRETVRLPAAA